MVEVEQRRSEKNGAQRTAQRNTARSEALGEPQLNETESCERINAHPHATNSASYQRGDTPRTVADTSERPVPAVGGSAVADTRPSTGTRHPTRSLPRNHKTRPTQSKIKKLRKEKAKTQEPHQAPRTLSISRLTNDLDDRARRSLLDLIDRARRLS